MIFTVGHKVNYDKYLTEYECLKKMGTEGDYEGGTVWKTYQQAKTNCPDGYDVYGVLADWDTQTKVSKTQSYPARDLLVSSLLVKITAKERARLSATV